MDYGFAGYSQSTDTLSKGQDMHVKPCRAVEIVGPPKHQLHVRSLSSDLPYSLLELHCFGIRRSPLYHTAILHQTFPVTSRRDVSSTGHQMRNGCLNNAPLAKHTPLLRTRPHRSLHPIPSPYRSRGSLDRTSMTFVSLCFTSFPIIY